MSAIFLLLSLICDIACIVLDTTEPLFSACLRASITRTLACFAFSAFCCTVEVISSILDAVSSRLEA